MIRPGEPGDHHAIVDTGGYVRAGYDVIDGTLVLIRPDGCLALVTEHAEQVADYWTALHGIPMPTAT